MVARAAIDFTSSWFDWFVKTRPVNGQVLTGGPNGTLQYTSPAAGGGADNTIYMSDYANSTAGVQAAIDDAANKCLVWDCARTVSGTVTVSNPTNVVGIGANATVVGASSEDDRGIAACVASGNLDPMFDVASDGVTISGLNFDGDASSSVLTRWAGKNGGFYECEWKYASVALEMNNQYDYVTIVAPRMMAGLTKCISVDLNIGTAYNNSHVNVFGGHMSASAEVLDRVAGGSGTAYNFHFYGCDFHDGHDANYMLEMSNMHYSKFFGCMFELHDSIPPGVGVIYCEAIGLAFQGCVFAGKDIGALTCIVGGSYDPIDVHGSTFANWYSGQTLMSGADFAGVDSCAFYNTAAATVISGGRRGDHTWS